MTKAVIKQLHIRDHLLKVARRTDNSDDWANYRVARNKAVSILRSAKREFYNNSFEENKNNTRAIWKSIKTLTGSKNNTRQIKNLKIDGREVDDKTEMAEQFNTYFSTVAEKIRRHLSTVPFDLFKLVNFVKSRKNDQEINFSVPVITISQVIKTIMKINPYKASGIDKISARLLRIAAPVIAPSITRIINMSLSIQASFLHVGKQPWLHPYSRKVLNVTRVTIARFRFCRYCPRSSSVIFTTHYMLSSTKTTLSTPDNLVFGEVIVLKLHLLRSSMNSYLTWTIIRYPVWY